MQSTTNLRPVSLKKVVSHFSRNLWPRICKKSQKTGYLRKFFFSLETTQNALKFVRNTICAVHDKFPVGISQKRRWSFFKKSVTPDMQKKSKNFFARNNLKCLKICSQHHLWNLFDKFQAGISQKRSWSFFKKSVTPDMQKKSKKQVFKKKFFFPRNNLKCLKICSQHHLCSPRQISGRYFSKKKLVIFQEICDPRICKKSQKKQIFKKEFFFPRNNLKRFKIRSQHHLCSPRKISGPYLSKKKLVIFQEICDPGYAKKVKKFPILKNFFSLETT